MIRVRVCAAVLAAALSMPAAATAHRSATRSERVAILAAVVHQGEISSRQAACQRVTVSTVNQSYAAVAWPAKLRRACLKIAANGVIIEQRNGAAWQLVAAGSSFQCPVRSVPTDVARDLGICGSVVSAHHPYPHRRHRPR